MCLLNTHSFISLQTPPLTVTPVRVTPRLQWQFWQFPDYTFVNKTPLLTVTIWLQGHFSLVPRVSLKAGTSVLENVQKCMSHSQNVTWSQSSSQNVSLWIGLQLPRRASSRPGHQAPPQQRRHRQHDWRARSAILRCMLCHAVDNLMLEVRLQFYKQNLYNSPPH